MTPPTTEQPLTEPAQLVSNTERCVIHGIECTEQLDCGRCGGEGMYEQEDELSWFGTMHLVKCYACAGTGTDPFAHCWMCLDEDES